ncbi:hypothetical protein BDY19DRAFT_906841 [Irpex rosettiformis]|uniref:Uncharacterized protein n=1 Tax=Irpex rosettiformis TaxID=378272 RepID=A0ACB8U250_9APHY|nr:hypothetical protein BDY19DRAFT_906841 [Irpex rosettiformis]
MSSSSFVDIGEDHEGRREFPFPTVSNGPTQSPSDSGSDLTPPYLARSLPEHRSSSGSSSRRRRTHDHESREGHRDRDRERIRDDDTPAKLLSRLASRSEYRDSKHLRTLLVLTGDKLEAETRRADQAEQRVVDVLHRLRIANEATALAQADASRAQQEVRLYQIQLETAQREITRAQEIVDQVERSRREAEEEAARARSVARKCREEVVLSRAREEGHKQGYREGLERGRRLGYAEAQTRPSRRAPSRTPPRVEETDDMEIELEEPSPPPRPRADSGRHTDYGRVPSVERVAREPTPPREEIHSRPRSSSRASRHRTPDHVPDFALIDNRLPVPTLTTPVNAPSPSHARYIPPPSSLHTRQAPPPSPQPLPIPEPQPRQRDSSGRTSAPRDDYIHPIPIHEAPPSPVHPHINVLPDNFIPYARDNDVSSIVMPPPHELSRPVSPVDASPARSDIPLPVPPPGHVQVDPSPLGSRESIIPIAPGTSASQNRRTIPRAYESSMRSRDYAYPTAPTASVSSHLQPPTTGMNSPQSRTSTRISEYDILGRPSGSGIYGSRHDGDRDSVESGRGYTDSRREPRTYTVPREPPIPEYTLEAGAGPTDYSDSEHDELSRPIYTRHVSSQSSISRSEGGGTWNRLLRRKSKGKSKRSTSDSQEQSSSGSHSQLHPVIPDIFVESPSTENSRPSSHATTAAPHLLSPEHAHHALPSMTDMFGFPSSSSKPSSSQQNYYQQPPITSFSVALAENPLPPLPTFDSRPYPASPYQEAPVPPNVVYPDVPSRSMNKSRASRRSEKSAGGGVPVVPSSSDDRGSWKSGAGRKSLKAGSIGDSLSLGGRLSPLSLFK